MPVAPLQQSQRVLWPWHQQQQRAAQGNYRSAVWRQEKIVEKSYSPHIHSVFKHHRTDTFSVKMLNQPIEAHFPLSCQKTYVNCVCQVYTLYLLMKQLIPCFKMRSTFSFIFSFSANSISATFAVESTRTLEPKIYRNQTMEWKKNKNRKQPKKQQQQTRTVRFKGVPWSCLCPCQC